MKNILNKIGKEKLIYYIGLGIWFVTDLLILILINIKLPNLIDSDMSAEMILSHILVKEKSIITSGWLYSSEIRVLYTQLLYTFFSNFTNDWHLTRFLSIICLHLILSGSVMYVFKKAGCKEYGPYAAVSLLLAFTYKYFYIMVCACAYVPFISVAFMTIGFTFAYGKETQKKKKIILICLACVLGFCAGLNGIRQIVITYIPLLLSAFCIALYWIYNFGWEKYKDTKNFRYLNFAFVCTIANGMGYLVNNKVLSRIAHFDSWSEIRFTDINSENFIRVLTDFLQTLGFSKYYMTIPTLISNAACALFVVALLYFIIMGLKQKSSDEYKLFILYFLSNVLIFFTIYTFTDMVYDRWYNFPILIYVFPIIAMGIHECGFGKAPAFTKLLVAVILILAVYARSSICYMEVATTEKNKDLIEIAEFLEDTDYNSGYASYWNNNVITEFTNGKIEMRTWVDSGKDGSLFVNQKAPGISWAWLQPRKHVETTPQGKVFTILKDNEIPYCNWRDKLRNEDILLKTESYTVYGYDSYEEMVRICAK